MNDAAALARAAAVHFEAKKTGFGQAQDGWSLTLRIQDADVPASVMGAKKGTRYMVALVEIGDDELPAGSSNGRTSDFGSEDAGSTPAPAAKRRFEEMPRSQQAGVLCNDGRFQEWLKTTCPTIWENAHRDLRYADDGGAVAGEAVRVLCDVGSRADLDDHPRAPAPMKWDRLVTEYRRSQSIADYYLPERRG